MKKFLSFENVSIGAGIVWIGIVILGIVGYVKNIIGLVECDFEPSYKSEVIRGIGVVVPPVGAVAGWIDFKDK
jgi:hypothetical protein